uniref:Alpha-2,8-sialyltransferase 8B-like n=1 Tax=Branchiostoma floridae TaxID=7739 RepID=C3YNM5_BRAFL|eukprot:XP_002602108.1 hypothetical protein BRAFLDRAFT_98957 [Branchiostoma floridae]
MSTTFGFLVAVSTLFVTLLLFLTHDDGFLTITRANTTSRSYSRLDSDESLLKIDDIKMKMIISYDKNSTLTDEDLHMLTISEDWSFNQTAADLVSNASTSLVPNRLFWVAELGNAQKTAKCPIKTAKKLPRRACLPSNVVRHQKTCALVGNSGILLGSDCGSEIDSKDYVVRMNLPLVRGFEKDVGKRTSMTIMNSETVRRLAISAGLKNRSQDAYESRLRDIEGSVLVIHKASIRGLLEALRRYGSRSFVGLASKTMRFGNDKEFNEINRIASTIAGQTFTLWPTMGLTTVIMVNTFCDRLHLYGFYPYQKDLDNRPIPYHYFPDDPLKPIIPNVNGHHNMSWEYNIHRELHRQGVYRMHVGPCRVK